MFYLRYLCLFTQSGVQHILSCVFVCFSSSCVPYVASFSELSIFYAPSVFCNVYLVEGHNLIVKLKDRNKIVYYLYPY